MVYFPGFLRSMVTGHPSVAAETPPGHAVTAFQPYLKHVPVAGYYTDRYNKNFWNSDAASRIYQQAQYALAPTLLDVEQCFDHPYVLFECEKPGCEKPLMARHRLELLIRINDTISLTRIQSKTGETP